MNLLYSIVDRIYIGRMPEIGTAVGLCFPIVVLITGFTNLCGVGGVACYITMWITVYRKLGREEYI